MRRTSRGQRAAGAAAEGSEKSSKAEWQRRFDPLDWEESQPPPGIAPQDRRAGECAHCRAAGIYDWDPVIPLRANVDTRETRPVAKVDTREMRPVANVDTREMRPVAKVDTREMRPAAEATREMRPATDMHADAHAVDHADAGARARAHAGAHADDRGHGSRWCSR